MPRKPKVAVVEPPAVEENFEHEDDFEGAEDDVDQEDFENGDEPEDQPEVAPPLDTSSGEGEADTHYLDNFLALRGVPRNILRGINPATAWLTVQTRDMVAQAIPLGHLAPDALETLADLGYEHHARFELRPTAKSDQVRYFAAVLPPLPDDGEDDDRDDRPNGAVLALAQTQAARMDRLESALTTVLEKLADPFAQAERAMEFVERITELQGGRGRTDGDTELIIKTLIEQFAPRLLGAPKEA